MICARTPEHEAYCLSDASASELTPHRHRRPRIRGVLRALASPSKFAVVGIFGIFVNQVALYVFTEGLGIYYLLSAVLASQVSTLNNFLLIEFWVFRGRDTRGNMLLRYLAYNAVNAATLVIRLPVMYVMTDVGRDQLPGVEPVRHRRHLRRPVPGRRQLDLGGPGSPRPAGDPRRLPVRHPGPAARPVAGRAPGARRRSTCPSPSSPTSSSVAGWIGGRPRLRISTALDGGAIRYREQLGALGAAFDVRTPSDGDGSRGPRRQLAARLVPPRAVHEHGRAAAAVHARLARLRPAPLCGRRLGPGRRRDVGPHRHGQDQHGAAAPDAPLLGVPVGRHGHHGARRDGDRVRQAHDAVVTHDERGQRGRPAARRSHHARHPVAPALPGGTRRRARHGADAGSDRHRQRVGAAPHPAAQVPRDVAHRLRCRGPVRARQRDPDGARRAARGDHRPSRRRSIACSRTPTTRTRFRRSPRWRRSSDRWRATTSAPGP